MLLLGLPVLVGTVVSGTAAAAAAAPSEPSSHLRRGVDEVGQQQQRVRGLQSPTPTPVADCASISDEPSCVTDPPTGRFCVWDVDASLCTLERPVCPLLSPEECTAGRNSELCALDINTATDKGCQYSHPNMWDTSLEPSSDWHGYMELGQTHVVRAKYETRHAPLPIADREAELLFFPTLEAPPTPQPTMAPTDAAPWGLESSDVVNSTVSVRPVDGTWTPNPANLNKLRDQSSSEYYIPNTVPDVDINFDLGVQRIVQGLHSQTWYVTDVTGSILVGLKGDDGCQEDMEDGGVNDCFPDSYAEPAGWTWFELSGSYGGYNTVREMLTGWMPTRYVQFRFRGGFSSYSSNWGIRDLKISGMLDGTATPGGGGGTNQETDPYVGYPYLAPVGAVVRLVAHDENGKLLGNTLLRDPENIRPLLEQSLTTTALDPYGNDTAWSATLPWQWMKEGTKLTVGTVDPANPERLLVHELTLHGLAMWGRHTLTRTKVLIFGTVQDVNALDTFTHPADLVANGMFGSMPCSELHFVDSQDWHLPYIVQGTNDGPALVYSEAERRAALIAAGQNDTGTEPGWDILKNQLTLKANNANNGRGLAITDSGSSSSPYSSNTNIFMGWALSAGPDQSGSWTWDRMGYWSGWSAAAWTGWTGMRPGDECGNTLIHELGHSQTLSHFTGGSAVSWGIENEYPQDGTNMPYHPWGYDTVSRRFRTWYKHSDPTVGKRDPMNGGESSNSETCFPQYTGYHGQKSQNWAKSSHILLPAGHSAGVAIDGAYKYSADTLQYERVDDANIAEQVSSQAMPPERVGVPIVTLIGTLGSDDAVCQIYPGVKSSEGNTFQLPDPFAAGLPSVYDGGSYFLEVSYESGPTKRGLVASPNLAGTTDLRYFSLNLALEDRPTAVELYRFDADTYPATTSSSARTLLFTRTIELAADPLQGIPSTHRAGRDWLGANGDAIIREICLSTVDCHLAGANKMSWRGDGTTLAYTSSVAAAGSTTSATFFDVTVIREEDGTPHTVRLLASRFVEEGGNLLPILDQAVGLSVEPDATHGVLFWAPYDSNSNLIPGTYRSAQDAVELQMRILPDNKVSSTLRVSLQFEIMESTTADLSHGAHYVSLEFPALGSSAYFVVTDPDVGPTSGTWWGGDFATLTVPLFSSCVAGYEEAIMASIKARQRVCTSKWQMNAGRSDNDCGHSLVLQLDGISSNPWLDFAELKGCNLRTHPLSPIEFKVKRWHSADASGDWEIGTVILDFAVNVTDSLPLSYIGNNFGLSAYGECEGDCDTDTDCAGDLVCFQSSGGDSVPGCGGLTEGSNDYCYALYGECEGGCDTDGDCQGDLVCFVSSEGESVPGCSGLTSSSATSYCFMPTVHTGNLALSDVGNNFGLSAYGECEGDCDGDSDCQGDLVCFQRAGNEKDRVTNCDGTGSPGDDYCYDPNKGASQFPSDEPTPAPSKQPSQYPSDEPSPANECDPNPCQNGGTCTDLVNAYSCDCTGTGYSGPTCSENINECQGESHGCDHNCADTNGGYVCSCNAGYTLLGDQHSCGDINECSTDNGGCEHTCSNTVGSFACSCNESYVLNADGLNCDEMPSSAPTKQPSQHPTNAPTPDPSAEPTSIPSARPSTMPSSEPSSNPSEVPTLINPCDFSPCGPGDCNYVGGGEHTCSCDGTGFEGPTCSDPINFCDSNPCPAGSSCVNNAPGFSCVF